MTKPISKLVLAAVLLSSIPLAASAYDRDHDGDRPGAWSTPAYPAYPAPARSPDAYRGYVDRPQARDGREHRWRERELAEVSAQLRALDFQRDRFYAENRFRPGKVRRFDRWYSVRRAELEQRWNELQTVAWR